MGWVAARQFFLKDLSVTASVVPDRKVVVTRLKDGCDTLFLTTLIRTVLFNRDRQTMLLDEFFKLLHNSQLSHRDFCSHLPERPLVAKLQDVLEVFTDAIRTEAINI